MSEKISKEEFEKQLANPVGELGKMVADRMNQVNYDITKFTYGLFGLQANEKILEIGIGNGKLLHLLLNKHPLVKVYGIDISKTMIEEAIKNNNGFIDSNRVQFFNAYSKDMPFDSNVFKVACAINWIYFIEDLLVDFKEIHRVLKPKGRFYVTLTPKSEMEKLNMLNSNFNFYEIYEVELKLKSCGFSKINKHSFEEKIELQSEEILLNSVVFEAIK